MQFESFDKAVSLVMGATTLACFPAVAKALSETSVSNSFIYIESSCIAAVTASAITAFVIRYSARKKIEALTQEITLLTHDLNCPSHSLGKHGVSSNSQFRLIEISEEPVEAKQEDLSAPARNFSDEIEKTAKKLTDSFCQNPLDSIEEKAISPHKQDGLHTAIEIEDNDESMPLSQENIDGIDYEQLAEAYVEKKTFKERMLARSRGVQSVLYERLSATKQEMMDDIPVIRRADGSIGDVGESWWDEALAEDKNGASFNEDFGIDEPTCFETLEGHDAYTDASVSAGFAMIDNGKSNLPSSFSPRLVPERSEISSRVADPFVPTSKNVESDSCLRKVDTWQQALAAMDRKIDDNLITGAPQPVFLDVVGNSDTLDEPDGLEDVTHFLSFKAPGGHPEITDTASYVNFLVENEFEAKSKGFGKHVKRYLKVG